MARYGKPPTKRTVAKMLTTLRAVFDLALSKQVLISSPAAHVDAHGRDSESRDALTSEELGLLREAVRSDPLEAAWMLTLAGLRRSEMLALTWQDIDFATGLMTVSKGRTALNGTDDTKTRLGHRVLPRDADRIGLLKDLRARQAEKWGLQQVRD